MMSPRLPLALLTHARRARRTRIAAIAACAACLVVATAATPVFAAASDDAHAARAASRAWSPFFDAERPVVANDARRVEVLFVDPSLAEWVGASAAAPTAAQRTAWLKRAAALQRKRLDALAAAGVEFQVEHRYLRVVNGVSVVVHGDGAQLLRGVAGVRLVSPVRTLWPTAISADGARGAAAVVGGSTTVPGAVRVAVLDTAVDSAHPAVSGHVASGWDATAPDGRATRAELVPNEHGTAVAGAVLKGAGSQTNIELLPIQVLDRRPARDGVETVLGDSDDLLAGLEHAVDPDGDGNTADGAEVALVASTTPFAGFTGSPADRAVHGADTLGTVVVAAAGNDGASGDAVGTVGSVAASTAALAVGAADLRDRTPAVDVRVHGGRADQAFADAPLLTTDRDALPKGDLPIVVIDAPGTEVVDYLDAELHTRVAGSVVLIATHSGANIARQVRAAADAGAAAVLVAAAGADVAAGTIDVDGASIPAIGLQRDDARAVRDAIISGTRLDVSLQATTERNPGYGTVAGFSSTGPRLDGAARPDALAPGVGMIVAGPDGSWRVASGTSIAAGWAAGQVASVRAAQPDWDAATVRAALMGSAIALGSDGDRPSVALQGAGVLDAARAADAGWITSAGRIDFGTIAPGSSVRRPLGLTGLGAAAAAGADLKILLDDSGHARRVTPALDGDQLVLDIAADAADGHVGGWLVLPDSNLRIPWSATIRDASSERVPLTAQLASRVLATTVATGSYGNTLSIAIGGHSAGDALGLDAVQRLEVRLVDAHGKDHGAIGGLDQALPGVYTFGVTGTDPAGAALAAGAWQLHVRYVPAADPDGAWREGPVATFVVEKRAAAK